MQCYEYILTVVTCETLSLKNGEVSYNASQGSYIYEHQQFYYVYTMASFTCDDGYTLSGSESSICQVSKTWSEQTPQCIPGNCTVYTIIHNSQNMLIIRKKTITERSNSGA